MSTTASAPWQVGYLAGDVLLYQAVRSEVLGEVLWWARDQYEELRWRYIPETDIKIRIAGPDRVLEHADVVAAFEDLYQQLWTRAAPRAQVRP